MAKKSAKRLIRFPRDEGSHPAFVMEWWYAHFNLKDYAGREYGAMVAFFNFGLKILYISDLKKGQLHHYVSGSTLHNVEKKLDLRWGRDRWFRTGNKEFSYHLQSYGGELGLNLDLLAEKPPLLGCGKGLIEWTGGRSYYYSLSRLKVKGQIELPGKKLNVKGMGFMDHQWLNALGEGGWDWFVAQLDNDTELVFWTIYNLQGSEKSRDLTAMFADNSTYHTQGFTLRREKRWVSPHSKREYGVRWRLRDEAKGLDLQIRALNPEQEIRMFETLSIPTFNFWEGRTSVSGHMGGKKVSGTGYAELVRLIERSG